MVRLQVTGRSNLAESALVSHPHMQLGCHDPCDIPKSLTTVLLQVVSNCAGQASEISGILWFDRRLVRIPFSGQLETASCLVSRTAKYTK